MYVSRASAMGFGGNVVIPGLPLSESEVYVPESFRTSIFERAALTKSNPRLNVFVKVSSRSVSLFPVRIRDDDGPFSGGASGAVAKATGWERCSSMPSVIFQK